MSILHPHSLPSRLHPLLSASTKVLSENAQHCLSVILVQCPPVLLQVTDFILRVEYPTVNTYHSFE